MKHKYRPEYRLCSVAFCCVLVLARADAQTDWPTFGHDPGVTEKFPKARYAITSPPSFYKNLDVNSIPITWNGKNGKRYVGVFGLRWRSRRCSFRTTAHL